MLLALSVNAFAQSIVVKGHVTDKATGEDIIGANVFLKGISVGASTDVFGNFEFRADEGEYEIVVSSIGYKDFTQPISVNGALTPLEIAIDPDLVQLDGVVVKAKADKESEEMLLIERKKSSIMYQSVGSDELSKKGVSNVEEGLTKVSGISKVGSKGVFVRGLGDRYNQVTVNGLTVPSTDPDKKVIDMSLFPSSVVENMSVRKTFNAFEYADFAGASIDISTKSYVDEPFFGIKVGTSYNSMTTFKDFKTFPENNNLGFATSSTENPLGISSEGKPDVPGDLTSNPFSNGFNPTTKSAPLNYNIGLSGGYNFDFGSSSLALIGAFGHQNDYKYVEGESRVLNSEGGELNRFDTRDWSLSTLTNAMFSGTYEWNNRNEITYTSMFFNQSDNLTEEREGYVEDYGRDDILYIRNTFIQTQLFTNQLRGSHELDEAGKFNLDWGVGYSVTSRIEPDRKQLAYQGYEQGVETVSFLTNSKADNHRFWGEMTDNEFSTNVGFTYEYGQLNEDTPKSKIYWGYQNKLKSRNVENYQYNVDFLTTGNRVDPNNPDAFFTDANYGEKYRYIRGIDVAQHKFEVEQNVHAGYLAYDYNVSERLMINAGARFESSMQRVFYRTLQESWDDPYRKTQYKSMDLLPSLNVKYSVNDNTNLRLAASKTLTRPGFLELVPFMRVNTDGSTLIGNDRLLNSQNYNLDLKYELFPNAGELIAVSAYGKYLQDPIEQIVKPQGGAQLFTFTNTNSAVVAGAELEVNLDLVNWMNAAWVEGFNVGFNATFLYSQIDLGDGEEVANMTNSKRALQGASPYIINASLGYETDVTGNWTSNVSVVYNVFGDRIFSVGSEGVGDVYENGFSTLDLVWNNSISEHWNVSLKAQNLLNPEITRTQEDFNNPAVGTQEVSNIKYGVSGSLSVAYKF
ncbi:TonB-dependent receptor (plasmid) [Aureibacter tunicatorum]|nr:TonB-dependent receptor [Aureibacter tunicatorum]